MTDRDLARHLAAGHIADASDLHQLYRRASEIIAGGPAMKRLRVAAMAAGDKQGAAIELTVAVAEEILDELSRMPMFAVGNA